MTPYGINIIVKPYKDIAEGLITPDGVTGELYEVLKVGEGYLTENGQVVPLEVKPGDIVAIHGKVLKLDVLCYHREELLPDKI
jgi:co-chaperonin GroES (HSP10)